MTDTLDKETLTAVLRATLEGAPDARGAALCLCAEWCGTCREFRAIFDETAAAHPQLAFRWVDIEDEADTLGEDLDIETFPTIVLGDASGALRFAAPIPPQRAHLERLLGALLPEA